MFGGSVQPAQSRKFQLASVARDCHHVSALISGVTDDASGFLSGGVFMNRSRKGCEQQGEKADERDRASQTRSFGEPVLHVLPIIRATARLVTAIQHRAAVLAGDSLH